MNNAKREEIFFVGLSLTAERKNLHMYAEPAESAFGTQKLQRHLACVFQTAVGDLGKHNQGGTESFVFRERFNACRKPRKERNKGTDGKHGI